MTTVCYNENDPESLRQEIARLRSVQECQRSAWEKERRALQKQVSVHARLRAAEAKLAKVRNALVEHSPSKALAILDGEP